MTDPRPSIAELQAAAARDKFTDEALLIDAAPVLLGIAAAALDFAMIQETREPGAFAQEQFDMLWAALSKVKP